MVVDLGTSSVNTTARAVREFSRGLVGRRGARALRPGAGALAVFVGATPELFEQVRPLIATFAADIALCGPVGCGQVLKILNNMMLFEHVVALSEAKNIGERAGVDPTVLFNTAPRRLSRQLYFSPRRRRCCRASFQSVRFRSNTHKKILHYALQLADEAGVDARGAKIVDEWFNHGNYKQRGKSFYPVISTFMTKRKTESDTVR